MRSMAEKYCLNSRALLQHDSNLLKIVQITWAKWMCCRHRPATGHQHFANDSFAELKIRKINITFFCSFCCVDQRVRGIFFLFVQWNDPSVHLNECTYCVIECMYIFITGFFKLIQFHSNFVAEEGQWNDGSAVHIQIQCWRRERVQIWLRASYIVICVCDCVCLRVGIINGRQKSDTATVATRALPPFIPFIITAIVVYFMHILSSSLHTHMYIYA